MTLWRLAASAVLLSCALFADNVLHPGNPVLDHSTLTTIGVQLPITGDDNFNATVSVRYRESGTQNWNQALPLFRVHPENTVLWTLIPQFAGSIFDLRPGKTYDIELHATDPDGPVDQVFTLSATTRTVPSDPVNARAVSVTDNASLSSALQAAQPGDVITLANGTYGGPIFFYGSGTSTNPIVIRGASRDGVVIDGNNCQPCNILEIYGSYVHIENLTLQNAERAIRFQTNGSQGNVVRRVHVRNTTLGIHLRANQQDYYIADNVVEGRLAWPLNYGSDGAAHATDDGIVVSGFGHVVAHNQISGYADALQIDQDGSRAIDFYGNEVLFTYDDGIEMDTGEGNVRCFRNRFSNTFDTISLQPILGGPAYVFRNIVVNVVGEQMKFHALGTTPVQETNGVLAYNNTFVSPNNDLYMNTPNSPHHFRIENNLFIGPAQLPPPGQAVNWGGPIDDGLFDYNGYFSDGWFIFNFAGIGYENFPNFAAAQAGGLERHGLLLSQPIFANGLTAPSSYTVQVPPQDVTLAAGSAAIDRGLVLPNINDAFTGGGPDLGAVESGCPQPIYGPRPQGVDETNETFGCTASSQPPPPPPSPQPPPPPVNPPAVTLSISPNVPTVVPGQSQQFTATVSGSTNQAVTWQISPANLGTIGTNGLYTAPNSVAVFSVVTVTATAVVNPSVSASTAVFLQAGTSSPQPPSPQPQPPAPVSVAISPATVQLNAGATQQFSATVLNTTNTGVRWSLSPLNGTLSNSGLYTAPNGITSPQTVTITATSLADPTKSASATVNVAPVVPPPAPPVSVAISPATVQLNAGATQQFSATVLNTTNTGVQWSLSPLNGTLSNSGLYTAPNGITSPQAVTITATSLADPTKSASATVNVAPVVPPPPPPTPATPVTGVTISPTAVTMHNGQAQQFTAAVQGGANSGVRWFITPQLGTITAAGLYTAPGVSAPQVVTISASSVDAPVTTTSTYVIILP